MQPDYGIIPPLPRGSPSCLGRALSVPEREKYPTVGVNPAKPIPSNALQRLAGR
jgi:hypothetical protein